MDNKDFDVFEVETEDASSQPEYSGEVDLSNLKPPLKTRRSKRILPESLSQQNLIIATFVLSFLAVVGNDILHDRLDFKTYIYGVGAFFAGRRTSNSTERTNDTGNGNPKGKHYKGG